MSARYLAICATALALAVAAPVQAAPASPAQPPGPDGVPGFGRCSAGAAPQGGPAANPSRPPIRPHPQMCLPDRVENGFVDIFNGHDLAGWVGEPGRWSVRDGVLTGETTAQNPLSINTFLIWSGGTVENFDLKFEWRLTPTGNSGLQYRSEQLEVPALGQYVLRGPQYDMGGGPNEPFTANLFEERGATFLATRGSFSWDDGSRRDTVAYVGGGAAPGAASPGGYLPTRGLLKTGDWNRGEIVARGDTVIHIVNDQVIGLTIDEYPGRLKSGRIGIQLHTGPVMKIEFRSLKLKQLPSSR